MTRTPSEAPVQAGEPTQTQDQPSDQSRKPARSRSVQPVLEKLFELYPHLFGAEFLPLKLGIFQELLASHPEHFERDSLKTALSVHTRSGRYLQSVASGNQRYDLQGAAVEDVAPEHVYLAMLELFRRRQSRSKEDLRPKFRAQLIAAFEASGLPRQEYLARVQRNNAEANTLLEEAFAEHDQELARQEALIRAFESSGKTPAEFADMYGLNQRDVTKALERKRRLQSPAVKP
ncbi:MAG TPA: ProQ/FINO family protein [Polaromonas sp.]|jgi:sRNA-binding protein